jgi:hypothetical protein
MAPVPVPAGGTRTAGGGLLPARADEENFVRDYDYENHRFQLTDHKSDNYARALDGYPLDVTLDSTWPGQSPDPNKQRFNADAMLDVAKWLDQQVSALQQGTYAPQSVGSTASVSYGPSDWNAANYLKDASGRVAKTVSDYTRDLINNLQQASKSIRAAAANNRGTEQANADSMVNQQNSMPGQDSPTSWG